MRPGRLRADVHSSPPHGLWMRVAKIPGQSEAPGGFAHTDMRKRSGAHSLGQWAVHAATRPPRAAARRSSSALPSPRGDPGNAARPRLPPGVFGPDFLVPRAPLFDATRSPPQRRRAHLCSERKPVAVPEGPGAASAIPGVSGEKAEDAWLAGLPGHGWPWLGTARLLLGGTSCLDEGVARTAGAAAPASDLNT